MEPGDAARVSQRHVAPDPLRIVLGRKVPKGEPRLPLGVMLIDPAVVEALIRHGVARGNPRVWRNGGVEVRVELRVRPVQHNLEHIRCAGGRGQRIGHVGLKGLKRANVLGDDLAIEQNGRIVVHAVECKPRGRAGGAVRRRKVSRQRPRRVHHPGAGLHCVGRIPQVGKQARALQVVVDVIGHDGGNVD